MATKGRGHGSHIPNVPGKSCRRKLSIAYFDFGATFVIIGLLWLYNIVILNGFYVCIKSFYNIIPLLFQHTDRL